MLIKGTVHEIIFRNDINGYSVIDIDASGELITATGVFSSIYEGEEVELNGDFRENKKYGKQFFVKEYVSLTPSNKQGIIKYLSSGLLKGVGEVMATRIVEKFGEDSLNIIEFNPRKLAEVRGISIEGALKIAENFASVKAMKDSVLFLQNFDISTNLAIKIYEVYKDKTKELVNKNPYRLVEDVDGIGFLTADKIAKKMGVDPKSRFRMRAGILHILKQNSEKNGSTYIPRGDLANQVSILLNFYSDEVFSDAITDLKLENVIKTFEVIEDEFVFEGVSLTKYYLAEQAVASKLVLFKNSFTPLTQNFDSEIKNFENMFNITFHEEQKNAMSMALSEGVSIITGGPGTGKTTIVKCVCEICKLQNKKFLLLAPTGRASKRLSESTGYEAKTIHRGLEVEMMFGKPSFKYNEQNKLDSEVILVDEVSMVDVTLMLSLLKAVNIGTQIVFIGDKNQLASVGAGNVLADMINSGVISYHNLTQIYRQSENSLIVINAHKINAGEIPEFNNQSNDFFYENKKEPDEICDTVIDLVTKRLPSFLKTEAKNIQVLAPLKIGRAGVDNLNNQIQNIVNPQKFGSFSFEFERVSFREGDKVMQTQNNYEMEWTKTEGLIEFKGQGIFNGDIGTIERIDRNTGETVILFDDGRRAKLLREDLYQITLAYAITVHKSQGCEFDYVVIPLAAGPNIILTRNLLYTAITRAKKLVVLVGSKANISRMVKNNYTAKRYSKLKEFLIKKNKEFIDLYE